MNKKDNFFKSFWYAITNFEKYKEFAYLKNQTVLGYVMILLLIFSVLITVALSIPVLTTVHDGIDYFEKDFPELNYSEGKLNIDSQEPIYLQDDNLDAVVIFDTNATSEDENKYLEENKSHATTIFVFSDKLIVKTVALTSYTTYEYSQIQENLGFDTFTKQDILEQVTGNQIYKVYATIYLFLFAYAFLTYTVMVFMEVVILSILAWFVSKLYKANLRYANCLKLAPYAITLSLTLQLIYVYINTFTGFTITYFSLMYDIISYIYIITAILIIKNDGAKQDIGLVNETKIESEDEKTITNEEVEEKKQQQKQNKKETTDNNKDKLPPDAEPGKA